jgi:hypothetical protein
METKKVISWDRYLLWTLAAHFAITTMLGALMRTGSSLSALHQFVLPLTDLIPNVKRYADKSVDAVFAETFIGCSLIIAAVLFVIFAIKLPAKTGKTFYRQWERPLVLIWGTFLCMGLICVMWFGPINPLSKGRAYFMIHAATSSYAGIVLVMNNLLVWIPLFMLLMTFGAFRSTSTHLIDHT